VAAEVVTRPAKNGAGDRRAFGYLPQAGVHLFLPLLAANATIRLLTGSDEKTSSNQLTNIDQVLVEFKLNPRRVRGSRGADLSGGEAQRLAIAITLALDPLVWIGDEPTSSLDGGNRARLITHLNRIRAQRRTATLIASHDVDFLRAVCDEVLVLDEKGLHPAPEEQVVTAVMRTPSKNEGKIVISLTGISHGYGGNWTPTRWVVRDFSADYRASRVYGIIGPSGAGKSSLLRIIAGHERPRRGSVRRYGGIDSDRPTAMLVPQDTREFFNPAQSIGNFAKTLAGGLVPSPEISTLADKLKLLNVDPILLDLHPSGPSGGETQRIALAICFWLKPKLLCLDEIDSGLDPKNKRTAGEAISRYAQEHDATVVIATHNLPFADATCDSVLLMEGKPEFVS